MLFYTQGDASKGLFFSFFFLATLTYREAFAKKKKSNINTNIHLRLRVMSVIDRQICSWGVGAHKVFFFVHFFLPLKNTNQCTKTLQYNQRQCLNWILFMSILAAKVTKIHYNIQMRIKANTTSWWKKKCESQRTSNKHDSCPVRADTFTGSSGGRTDLPSRLEADLWCARNTPIMPASHQRPSHQCGYFLYLSELIAISPNHTDTFHSFRSFVQVWGRDNADTSFLDKWPL